MPNINSSGPPVLHRRPEARGFRVEQILEEARIGRLRIPSFQRPLRWRSRNVIEFFDSIRRGFPIGELLLSRKAAPAATINFGPVAIESGEHHGALWVVDGQQRVTALVAALLRSEKVPRGDYWAAWYDLENEEFRILARKEADPSWIPLNVLSDSVTQLKWIRNWVYAETREDLVNRVLELGKSIREYEIPAYIVEGADEKVLRLIFTRSNVGGVPMRDSEIFEALYGQEGDKPIRSAVARLADLGFGELDEDLFLRCLRAACNPLPKDHLRLEEGIPENAIRNTEAALRRTIQTITSWAGIPIFKLMPYRLPLYVLSAFYDRFPEENTKVDRLVSTWIWRAAIAGDHGNSSDARVVELVSKVRAASSAEIAISNMIGELGDFGSWKEKPNNPLRKLEQKISLNSAAAKILVLGLIAANPRKLNDGRKTELFVAEPEDDLPDGNRNGPNRPGRIHPDIYMAIVGSEKLGIDIVIRLAGMKPGSTISGEEFDLLSFRLNAECVKKADLGDVEGFRAARLTLITRGLEDFVLDRIGDMAEIRPSISAIAGVVQSTELTK